MNRRAYQILDVGLVLESSRDAFLEAFHRNYARFEVAAPPDRRVAVIRFEAGTPGTGPWVEVDGARMGLAGHPNPEAFAAQVAARTLMERVEAFTILHAAVLGEGRGALALAGPPGAGKTTLALALLATGSIYYSDDFCPIHRATGRVHPFPRSLWVRPGAGGEPGRPKTTLPLDGFPVGGPPLPLRWLVCLGGKPGGQGKLFLRLRGDSGQPLLAALRELEDVELTQSEGGAVPGWTLTYPQRGGAARQVREVLRRHPDAAWSVFSLLEAEVDFTGEPVLTPIPASEAAFFLLRELKQDLASGPAPGALLSHLGQLLGEVACFRLTPGPLKQCLALVRTAVAEEVTA